MLIAPKWLKLRTSYLTCLFWGTWPFNFFLKLGVCKNSLVGDTHCWECTVWSDTLLTYLLTYFVLLDTPFTWWRYALSRAPLVWCLSFSCWVYGCRMPPVVANEYRPTSSTGQRTPSAGVSTSLSLSSALFSCRMCCCFLVLFRKLKFTHYCRDVGQRCVNKLSVVLLYNAVIHINWWPLIVCQERSNSSSLVVVVIVVVVVLVVVVVVVTAVVVVVIVVVVVCIVALVVTAVIVVVVVVVVVVVTVDVVCYYISCNLGCWSEAVE